MSPDNYDSKRKKAKKGNNDAREFRFVQHSLSTAQQEDIQGYLDAGEWSFQDVVDCVQRGYAFKLSPDTHGGGYRAHLIDTDEKSADYNSCLTGRGSAPIDAIYALLYRHLVLAPEGWGVLDDNRTGRPKFS